jgi:hypothetical protein
LALINNHSLTNVHLALINNHSRTNVHLEVKQQSLTHSLTHKKRLLTQNLSKLFPSSFSKLVM